MTNTLHTGHEAEMAAQAAYDAEPYNPTADLKGVLSDMLANMAADENGTGFSALFGFDKPTTEQHLESLERHIARIRRNMGA